VSIRVIFLGFKICAQIKGISGLEHKKSASN
jgi:hypothetical protein